MLSPGEFEERPRFRRIGFYLGMLVVVGICLATMVYVVQMQLLGWSVSSATSPASMPLTSRVRIVLYRSAATEQFLASVGGNIDTLLRPWRNFATQHSISLTEVRTLEGLQPTDGQVLVLASAVALSDGDREAVMRFRSAGGSVLATWATGSRHADGQWAGWSFLEDLAGVSVVADMPAGGSDQFMVTQGQGPLTHGLPAGQRVWLGQVAERALVFRGSHVAAHAPPRVVADRPGAALLVYQEFAADTGQEHGRVVAWGVPETAWEFQPTDMHTLVSGMLSWLARQPVLVASDWPHAQRAAHSVALRPGQQGLPEALVVAQQLQHAHQPTSLFVASDAAGAHRDGLQRLRPWLDVGYQGDILQGFGGQSAAVQRERVARMVEDMGVALGETGTLAGFAAAADSQDATTAAQLYAAGVRYRLGVGADTTVAMPHFQAISGERAGQRFVVLPHPGLNLQQRLSLVGGEEAKLLSALTSEFDAARQQGSLSLLVLDTEAERYPGLSQRLVPSLAAHWAANADGVWRASGADIARWWNGKERFQISVRSAGARIELDASVLGDANYDGAALLVMLPRKGALPQVRALKTGLPVPRVESLDDFRATIRFGSLAPGNYTYQLTF